MLVVSFDCVLKRKVFWINSLEYIWHSIFFPLSSRKSESGLQEWGIVELQGDLEVRGNEVMENQFIGDLNYDKYGQPVRVSFATKIQRQSFQSQNMKTINF